jgi:hypothetical protein
LNYKSNVQIAHVTSSKGKDKQEVFRPSIKVVGNFGADMTNMPPAGKSTRLANYFNTGKNTELYWKPEPMKVFEQKQILR